MRLDDYRESENVEQDAGGGGGGFGGGGGGIGLLFALVGSRFGLGGIVVLFLGMLLFGINPLGGGSSGSQHAQTNGMTAAQTCDQDPAHQLSCRVLASTEDTWSRIFQQRGQQYRPATLHFYNRADTSGCGAAQSAMGPFYCPTDQGIYLDPEFFSELDSRFHAAGSFAEAYVIAHEVGHNVQYLTGIADKVRAEQQQADTAGANALQVKMELQADCYAGVWAANAKSRDGQPILEPGEAEQGLRAANAIGDDTLQRSAGRTPVPDSFTHGTSAERVSWLRKGLDSGDPAACDTFSGAL